ncbi:N-6 DNA methylase [Bdellovibrio bacteriovorus]|uniref:type I restriction-modification system subunit M n=1 Tax=Bdellovibrio bacteriovorus TaxID=959 RepID=UPI0035A67574
MSPTGITLAELERRLWEAADKLWANSNLRPSEYSVPVLGLIFLRYADVRFQRAKLQLESQGGSRRREIGKEDYKALGVMYLPEAARWDNLLSLPDGADIGKALNDAMKAIEADNEDLKDVLPKTYNRIQTKLLNSLFRTFNLIPADIEGDAFGRIYEYFMSEFEATVGQKGGEFFTPTSIVKLIVEIIEPFHGKIFDPACGSGGMFVQSAQFVERHKHRPSDEIAVYGQEKTAETVRICRMNLAINGISGDIKQGNSYYENSHSSLGKFDFVMANPPFNVSEIDKERIKDDKRFPYGMPSADNGNYIWIQLFLSALNSSGRAGFVMPNTAADSSNEFEIRKQIVESDVVDCMIEVTSNFFYTVTLPCSLWFFDKQKDESRKGKTLFIDARSIFSQVSRVHREFTPQQTEFLANIVRLYKGKQTENEHGSAELLEVHFGSRSPSKFKNVPGLCYVASLQEISKKNFSLNAGNYVGVKSQTAPTNDYRATISKSASRLDELSREAVQTDKEILAFLKDILSESEK